MNGYDGVMDFKIDGVITGFQSWHDNGKEDRRWKVKWCKTSSGIKKEGCYLTGYINGWDSTMDYTVPLGRAVVGMYSHHDNKREDRLWKLFICSFSK